MSNPLVSRRGFFRHAASATAAGATAGQSVPSPPSRAWTVLGINWEYNDEFCFEAGEFIAPQVYFDEQQAIAACQKLTSEFFGQSPQEFEPCWDAYEVDPATATWDDARRARCRASRSRARRLDLLLRLSLKTSLVHGERNAEGLIAD